MYILTQFLSESLNKHVNRTYKLDGFGKGFIDIMAAEQSMDDTNWFQGTADAVRRCLKHFNDPSIKYIMVLSGDQLYKMNLRDMYSYHVEKDAEVTVACNCVPERDVTQLGIMGMDESSRICKFVEKPKDPGLVKDLKVSADGREFYMGSMGIYLFNKETLINLLSEDNKVDFGKEIIPDAIKEFRTYAYLFDGYWRDIGTIRNFYDENLTLTSSMPPLNMFDEKWQIFTRSRHLPPAKFEGSKVEDSIVAEGAILQSAQVAHSIIGLRMRVGSGTSIEETIAMGCDFYETVAELEEDEKKELPAMGIGKNCIIKKAILDKNVRIGDNVKILNEKKVENFEGSNYYIRDGIVIITKGSVIPSGTVI